VIYTSMHFKTIRLQQFRNHADSTFELSSGTNILLGNNGQGKTNVLEAISYLCLTKSFYAGGDYLVLKFGSPMFEVEGAVHSDNGQQYDIRVAFTELEKQKIFTINKHRVDPLSSVIGKFPIVICSPEHAPITSDGPSERRKFIDFVISQSDTTYFQNLIEYRRVIKHRNKVLFDGKVSRRNVAPLIEPWNEQLIERGSYLIIKRRKFIEEFQEYINTAYRSIASDGEYPSIEYQAINMPNVILTQDEIRAQLRTALNERQDEELRAGTTIVGPHRDELLLTINGLDLRKFASQGQHKTFLIALKIGEFFYLKDRCTETPILLLDDIFSELDHERAERLLGFVSTLSQTFITSTNPHFIPEQTSANGNWKTFHIAEGKVVAEEIKAA
jgi:DNA replication and repair protein RecF